MEEEIIDYYTMHQMDLADTIVGMYEVLIVTDKRKKDYKEQIKEYNKLVDIYNKRLNNRVFNKIK